MHVSKQDIQSIVFFLPLTAIGFMADLVKRAVLAFWVRRAPREAVIIRLKCIVSGVSKREREGGRGEKEPPPLFMNV
jgi:hypothetical protein